MTIRTLLAPIFLLACFAHLYGQSSSRYSGPFRLGQYVGEAEFDYRVEDSDTIFQGPFLLKQSDLGKLVSTKDNYFTFDGAFQSNVPQGPWHFQFGEFGIDTTDAPEVRDYRYEVKTIGTHHEALGNMLAGRPHGKWIQTIQRIKASQVEEILFKSTIDFNRGIPQKGFKIQNERMTLVGRFLRDGLAHDVWELYSVEAPGAIERWYFTEGRLEKIQISDSDSTFVLQVNASIENPQVLNLDDRYLKIIKLNLRLATDNYIDIKGEMNSLLAENANHYRKIDMIFSELGGYQFMPEFKVKVDHNPLNKSELEQLNSVKTAYERNEKISQGLLNNTQINILKLSDNEALFLLSVINELSEKHLTLLKEVTEFYDQNILLFVPRKKLLSKLWLKERPSTEIIVSYETADSLLTRSYRGPDADRYTFESDGIQGIYELSNYLSGCIRSIQERISEKLTEEQRQQELIVLEEKLITEVTALNHLIDSLGAQMPGQEQSILKNVKETAKKELSAYSALEDASQKPDQAQSLISCFSLMQELSQEIVKLPAQRSEIRETYMDEVWNPFTATLMNEEVKRRILMSYEEVLYPYLVDQLNSRLSCDNTNDLKILLENTNQRMLELRDEDTDKLERKLRRERDPLTIIQLFGIERENERVDGP